MTDFWERFKLWRFRRRRLPKWFSQWLDDRSFEIDHNWECAPNVEESLICKGQLKMIEMINVRFFHEKWQQRKVGERP